MKKTKGKTPNMKTALSEYNISCLFHDIKNTMNGANPDQILSKKRIMN